MLTALHMTSRRFRIGRILSQISLLLIAMASVPAWAGSVSYTYDSLGRVTQITYSTGVVITYTYDASGNRVNYVITGAP